MNKYLHQDITDYIYYDLHRILFDKVNQDYKNTMHIECYCNPRYVLRSIQYIEENNVPYLDKNDDNVMESIRDPEYIGILCERYTGPWFRVNYRSRAGSWVNIYNFRSGHWHVGTVPKNYMYTYEREGWLKEVVESST